MSSEETGIAGEEEAEMEEVVRVKLGCYGGVVKLVEDPSEEIMLLWGLRQPIYSNPNAYVLQSSLSLRLDACGHSLRILQSPSSLVLLFFFYLILILFYVRQLLIMKL